jgi:hypothetical protein
MKTLNRQWRFPRKARQVQILSYINFTCLAPSLWLQVLARSRTLLHKQPIEIFIVYLHTRPLIFLFHSSSSPNWKFIEKFRGAAMLVYILQIIPYFSCDISRCSPLQSSCLRHVVITYCKVLEIMRLKWPPMTSSSYQFCEKSINLLKSWKEVHSQGVNTHSMGYSSP